MKLQGASCKQRFSCLTVPIVQSGHVQYEIVLERGPFIPTTNPIDRSRDPGKFLDLSFYLLLWVGTPNDVQRPHF